VFADIKAASGRGDVDDIARAVGGAESALVRGDVDGAVGLLEWAKAAAARSWAVREALGIAYYMAGRYKDAQRELVTYRRLSGQQDQNHLLADCARALGDSAKMRGYVDAMFESDVEDAVRAEGVMVVAGEQIDQGDLDGALRTLQRITVDPGTATAPHLRMWYLEADVHARKGDRKKAQALRERIAEIDPAYLAELDR
jgi:tetratricopeptide (TPR) repeat protein